MNGALILVILTVVCFGGASLIPQQNGLLVLAGLCLGLCAALKALTSQR